MVYCLVAETSSLGAQTYYIRGLQMTFTLSLTGLMNINECRINIVT